MRLRIIWTLRGMTFRERLNRTGDALAHGMAHHLPRKIAYWSFIDTGVRLIRNDEVVPEVRYTDLLSRI